MTRNHAERKFMGTRFSIGLYFPIDQLATALLELNKLADQQGTRLFSVQLPNGSVLDVSCNPISPPRYYGAGSFGFYTALLFQVDGAITAHLNRSAAFYKDFNPEEHLIIVDGTKYFPLGWLGVSVGIGESYACLWIGAAGGSQNDLFRFSTSFHNAMLNLLKAANGIAGLINVESYNNLLLADTSRIIRLDFDEDQALEDGSNVDEMVRSIQRQLASS
jgi:hypothetical protein